MRFAHRALVAVGLAAGVLLAPETGIAQRSASIDAVIEKVERRYNRARTMQADFIQRYTSGPTTRLESGDTMVESGVVLFRKPGRMRWEYQSPEEKLFLTDGKYSYFYVPAERQVRRQKIKESGYWQTTFALILGRMQMRKAFGKMELVILDRPDDPVKWQLRGYPRVGSQGFERVVFDLTADYGIRRVEIKQRDGSLMVFHFLHWIENPRIDEGKFQASFPEGTAVILEGDD